MWGGLQKMGQKQVSCLLFGINFKNEMNDYDIFGLQPIFIITIFSSDEAILHLTKANFPPAT